MKEELQFVIDFYQKSWDNLLWVIGFAGAFLGFIWPLLTTLINYRRDRNYKKELDRTILKKKDEIDKFITNSIEKIDEKSKMLENRIIEIEKNENRLTGNMFFTQAQSTNDPFMKIIGLLYAYKSFIIVKDTNCMTLVYCHLSPFIQHNQNLITKQTITTEQLHILKHEVENIIDGLIQLDEINSKQYYIGIFEDFRKQLEKI
jgi:hypothetical protein